MDSIYLSHPYGMQINGSPAIQPVSYNQVYSQYLNHYYRQAFLPCYCSSPRSGPPSPVHYIPQYYIPVSPVSSPKHSVPSSSPPYSPKHIHSRVSNVCMDSSVIYAEPFYPSSQSVIRKKISLRHNMSKSSSYYDRIVATISFCDNEIKKFNEKYDIALVIIGGKPKFNRKLMHLRNRALMFKNISMDYVDKGQFHKAYGLAKHSRSLIRSAVSLIDDVLLDYMCPN